MNALPSKIVQIAVSPGTQGAEADIVYVLCQDGSVHSKWFTNEEQNGGWQLVNPPFKSAQQIWKNPCPTCGAQSMEDSEIRCQAGYVCLASEQRALEDQT